MTKWTQGLYQYKYKDDITYIIQKNNGELPSLNSWIITVQIGDWSENLEVLCSTKKEAVSIVNEMADNWTFDKKWGWCYTGR